MREATVTLPSSVVKKQDVLTALEQSIYHWERLLEWTLEGSRESARKAAEEGWSSDSCPLCLLLLRG